MLEHHLDSRGILHLQPRGTLAKEDFAKLASTVGPYIEKHGDLTGIVLDAAKFPGWDSLGAMAAHIRSSATIKHFPAGQTQAAEQWILGKS